MDLLKKLSVNTINTFLISLIVIVFMIPIVFSYSTILKRIDNSSWESHTRDVIVSIDNLNSDLENAETGQRGYIITGQEEFLQPYNSALPDIDKSFKELQVLTKDNSIQQERLIRMRPLIDAKLAELKNTIGIRRDKGFDAALQAILTTTTTTTVGAGKVIMDEIRKIVEEMKVEETNLLQTRTNATNQTTSNTLSILIWGSLIGLLFYIVVSYIINRFVIGEIVKKSLLDKEKEANKATESANKELRSLDLAKDEFVSIASHQLRTPLTALKGYTSMLLDGDAGPISDKQREYLGEIKNANNRMIALITALLNVSRVDLDVFVVEPIPVNLEEVAESVLKELEKNILDKKLKMETSFEKDIPLLNVDPTITRMIFQNLLSNAVKYTPLEGSIFLNIKKDGLNLLISVTDTGYGIPKTAESKIFTKLFRADNARVKDPNGTGLGLYIIRATIEKTGGKIWFESKENKGSTFYVSIPLEGMKKQEGSKRLE